MKAALGWIERALFGLGIVLALWCAARLIRSSYYAHLPVPPPSASHESPSQPAASPGNTTPAPAQIRNGAWLARLDAPSVHLRATVLEGTDDGTLAKGAGHIEDTPFPGQPGNVGIAGHRDTTFRAVRNLKVGDEITLTTAAAIDTYRITWTKVVEPDDVYVLDPTAKPALTLVTCFPFRYIGHAPHRYIVRADLVSDAPRKAE